MTFVCANCGYPAAKSDVDDLDSGTVLICDKCGSETVVDLFTPEYRRAK